MGVRNSSWEEKEAKCWWFCELFCPSLNIHGSLWEMGAGIALPWWPTLCVTWVWVSAKKKPGHTFSCCFCLHLYGLWRECFAFPISHEECAAARARGRCEGRVDKHWREKTIKVNIIFGCYSQIVEMQKTLYWPGIGIFQLALMPRMPLHSVKDKKSRQGFMPYL